MSPGPIAEPEDAAYVLSRTTGVAGFFGASSMERLPVERALTAQVRAFTELSIGTGLPGGAKPPDSRPEQEIKR